MVYVYTCLHSLVKRPAWWRSSKVCASKPLTGLPHVLGRLGTGRDLRRGRRFFISKQSTLDQDRGHGHGCHEVNCFSMFAIALYRFLTEDVEKKWLTQTTGSADQYYTVYTGHLSWLCCPLFFIAASEEQS